MQVSSIASSCAALGHPAPAVELVTALERVARDHRLPDPGHVSLQVGGSTDRLDTARSRLSPEVGAAARSRGQQLDYDALVERALEIADEVATGFTVG
jgi:hypothetical protein